MGSLRVRCLPRVCGCRGTARARASEAAEASAGRPVALAVAGAGWWCVVRKWARRCVPPRSEEPEGYGRSAALEKLRATAGRCTCPHTHSEIRSQRFKYTPRGRGKHRFTSHASPRTRAASPRTGERGSVLNVGSRQPSLDEHKHHLAKEGAVGA